MEKEYKIIRINWKTFQRLQEIYPAHEDEKMTDYFERVKDHLEFKDKNDHELIELAQSLVEMYKKGYLSGYRKANPKKRGVRDKQLYMFLKTDIKRDFMKSYGRKLKSYINKEIKRRKDEN